MSVVRRGLRGLGRMALLALVLPGAMVALVAVSLPGTAHATVVTPVTVAELTRRSDDVVVATVRRASPQWDGGRIVTDYELELLAVLKGRLVPHGTVTVRLPGGVVGRIGQTVPGVPGMEPGGTYLLFLDAGVSGLRYLTHLTASVVPVTAGATGPVQAQVPEGMTVVSVSGPGPGPAGVPAAGGLVALEVMTRAVTGALAGVGP